MFYHFGITLRIPENRLCPPVSYLESPVFYLVFSHKSNLGPESVLGSVLEDNASKSYYMDDRLNYILWIQDIVHAHDYVLGNPHRRVRGIDMYAFSLNHFLFVKELMIGLTEEQGQLLYTLSLDASWSRNGNSSPLV